MANTLTPIVPKILARGLLALRRQTLAPRLVNTDFGSDARRFGSTVDVPISSAIAAQNVTPSNTPPAPQDSAPTTVAIPLDQWKRTSFFLTDKQKKEIDADATYMPGQMSEAVKGLAEEVNKFIFGLYKGIYEYVGTAATTPFASDLVAYKDARKRLNSNAAPRMDRRVVLDVDAEANALVLSQFLKADERGDQGGIIEGQIGRKLGADWFWDQQIPTHITNATGAGALTVNGAHAVGVTTISVAKGAGANWDALKGDIITFAGHSQTYAIAADVTVVAATNTDVTITRALVVALVGAEAITVKATHVVNLLLQRDAIAFASRPMLDEDSMGNLIQSMTDPVSGLTLRLEVSRQYKQTVWELDLLYGGALVRAGLACRIAG